MSATRPKTSSSLTSRLGGWLPEHPHKLNRWLKDTIDEAEKRWTSFHPVIEEFRHMIESDPIMYMYFSQMFEQQPRFPPPPGSGDVKIKDYHQMLVVMNHVISTAPTYNTTGMVGCPINAILDFPMITPAGLSAFLMQKVNTMLRKVLNVWARYLDSEDSLYVLNETDDGWLNPDARKALNLDEFVTNPDKPFLGFKSWNDFFIREFKPGMRPVASPDDDSVIVERLRIRALRDPGPGEGARLLLAQGTTLLPTPHAERALRGPILGGHGLPSVPEPRSNTIAGTAPSRASSGRWTWCPALTTPRRPPRDSTRPDRTTPKVTSPTLPRGPSSSSRQTTPPLASCASF